ncbi:hypothetical protein CAPTEDRAFT_198124 [Capitella teleta]|uniref:Uncharacterized protein n=1 Tax=Capitella teleta TaxID=283909 RepID=X1ZYB4_CAPTE|nr:hypothetical protein CAPTEDRAFT_198124 [Capitella teleta]|eukprot:ELU04674.1 hypothetical protein CAPTEDRAFT_198124 [Capitella teleta]
MKSRPTFHYFMEIDLEYRSMRRISEYCPLTSSIILRNPLSNFEASSTCVARQHAPRKPILSVSWIYVPKYFTMDAEKSEVLSSDFRHVLGLLPRIAPLDDDDSPPASQKSGSKSRRDRRRKVQVQPTLAPKPASNPRMVIPIPASGSSSCTTDAEAKAKKSVHAVKVPSRVQSNAAVIFFNENRGVFTRQYPFESTRDIDARLKAVWKGLDITVKAGYFEKAHKAEDMIKQRSMTAMTPMTYECNGRAPPNSTDEGRLYFLPDPQQHHGAAEGDLAAIHVSPRDKASRPAPYPSACHRATKSSHGQQHYMKPMLNPILAKQFQVKPSPLPVPPTIPQPAPATCLPRTPYDLQRYVDSPSLLPTRQDISGQNPYYPAPANPYSSQHTNTRTGQFYYPSAGYPERLLSPYQQYPVMPRYFGHVPGCHPYNSMYYQHLQMLSNSLTSQSLPDISNPTPAVHSQFLQESHTNDEHEDNNVVIVDDSPPHQSSDQQSSMLAQMLHRDANATKGDLNPSADSSHQSQSSLPQHLPESQQLS